MALSARAAKSREGTFYGLSAEYRPIGGCVSSRPAIGRFAARRPAARYAQGEPGTWFKFGRSFKTREKRDMYGAEKVPTGPYPRPWRIAGLAPAYAGPSKGRTRAALLRLS
jgi:hypothetical protein